MLIKLFLNYFNLASVKDTKFGIKSWGFEEPQDFIPNFASFTVVNT